MVIRHAACILVLAAIVTVHIGCGSTDEKVVTVSLSLPADWESVLDMDALGAVSSTPYIGTVRFLYGTDQDLSIDFPYDSGSASFDAGQADELTVQALTAGQVIMEGSVQNLRSGSGDVTVTLEKVNGFSGAGSLLYPRQNHSAVLVSGTIYIIGGNLNTGIIETLSGLSGSITSSAYAASLTYPRDGAAVLHDAYGNRLFVFKGATAVDDNLYEIVDLDEKIAVPRTLSNPRYKYFPLVNNQEAILFGGYDGISTWFESSLLINFDNFNEYIWTGLGTSVNRNNPQCISNMDKLSCFGGESEIIEVFNLTDGKIDYSIPIFPNIEGFTATSLESGNIIVIGGLEGVTGYKQVKILYPYTGEFSDLSNDINYERYFHTATILNSNKILIIGGGSNINSAHSAELLDLGTGESTLLPWRMKVPRIGHTATLLPDGRVLVAGGSATDKSVEVFTPRSAQ
jgi:hypothetical protein